MSSSTRADLELDACLRQQDAVRELSRRALGETDLDALLQDATETVTETLSADYAGAFQLHEDGDDARLRAGTGWRDEAVGTETVPADSGSQAGAALTDGDPVVVEGLQEGSRFSRPELLADHDVDSGISAVLGPPGDPWGVIEAHDTEVGAFTEHDAAFLESVANVLASAIETGRAERGHESELDEPLERVTDAVYALDEEWRYTYVNEEAEALLGRSETELRDEVAWDVYPEAVGTELEERYREAMETQEPVSFEHYSESLGIWAQVEAYPSETGLSVYFRDVTERKEMEEALRETEAKFRRLAEHLDQVVWMTTEDQREVLYVNPAFEEVWGRDREELYEDPEVLLEAVHPEDREMVLEELDKVVEDEYEIEYRIVRPDGEVRWIHDRATPIYDDDGDVYRIVGDAEDVTERKERENELERYETIVETVNDGIYVVDEEGRFTMVNEAYEALTGYSRDQLLGEHVSLVVDEDIVERAASAEASMRDGGVGDPVIEAELETASGDRVLSEATFAMLPRTGDGVGEHRVGVARDVTEREKREQALEESRRRHHALVENFPNGAVVLVDDDLRYRIAGGTPVDVDAETADDLEGAPIREAISPELADVLEPKYRAALDGESSTFEHEHGGGYSRFHIFPVRDDDGDVFAAMGMSQDLTDRKRMEDELRESGQRYRTLAENFPNGIVSMFDQNLRYTLAAGQAFGDLSEDADDVQGRVVRDAWGDDVADLLEPAFEAALDGEQRSVQLEYAGRDWIVHVVPITDDAGTVFAGMSMAQDVTEQREQERYLHDAKAQLEAATEAGAVGTWEWNVQEDEMNVGPSFARTFGLDPDAAREGVALERFVSSIHEDDRERVEAKIEEALATCGEYEAEYRVRNADDEYRWVVARGHVECDDDGDPVTFPGALTDITERKRAELERQRGNEQLETLFEVLPVGVVVAEADGRLVEANDTAKDIWGGDVFDADSVEEYEQYSAVWADSGEPVEPDEWTMARVLRGEAVTDPDVFDIETEDGQRRIVRVVGMPVRDASGDVTRGVVTITDITERRESQRRLEESERRHRTLVENFPNGSVGLFDEDLRYTAVGGQLVDTLHMTPEERVGRNITELHPDDLVEDIEPYFQAALDGEENSFEVEYRGHYLHAHTLPVRDADDEVFAGMLVVQDVTDRKEMEREVRESEAKFRMLAENLEEVVWMATPDVEDFIYINPAFEEIWGLDRERLYDEPMTFFDAVHEEDRERVRASFDELPEAEFDEEFRIVRPGGELRWIHARGREVEDEDGELVRIVGIGEDITERVERERELERALDLLERTERIADVAGWEIDPDTQEVFWSDHLFDILDVSDDEQPSLEEALDVYHTDEDRAIVEDAVEEALDSGDPIDVEARFPRPDGDVGWLRIKGQPEVVDGEVVTLRGAVQDVTDRKERERELERALDLLGKTERIADVGGWEIDVDTMEVFWTDHVFDLLEVSIEEQPSLEKALDMYHEDDRQAVEGAIEEALEARDPFDVEARIRTERGEVRWLRLQGVPEIVDGEVVTIRGAAQDVTERKEHERELEELVGELETSNERLEQFAYAASHDLQEPLRMVSSYLQLVERRYGDQLDGEGCEFVGFAVDGAERMRDMIDGLLRYSRVDTRGDPFEAVDLDAVFEDVRLDLKVKIEDGDAEITAEDLPRVYGDGGQLNQVFQNLVSNAIEYSGDEPPRIHVSAERRDARSAPDRSGTAAENAGGNEWVISVRDEGIGIDAEEADQVFDVFQRLHGPDEYSGTGIGLALCERIVERHGGDIWVDAEPGEGATFSFTLPEAGEYDE